MESKYSAVLCRLFFLSSAKKSYVVSILLRTVASFHHILFAMSACCLVRSCLIDFSIFFLSLLLKRCLFLWEFFFLCHFHLICDQTDFFSCLNFSLYRSLFLTEVLVVLIFLTFFLLAFLL